MITFSDLSDLKKHWATFAPVVDAILVNGEELPKTETPSDEWEKIFGDGCIVRGFLDLQNNHLHLIVSLPPKAN